LSSGMVATLQNLHKRLQAVEPVMVDRKDEKSSVPKMLVSPGKRSRNGNTFHGKAQSMKTTLTIALFNGPTAANTSMNAVITLTPGSCTEFANLANLFDDWRTTHIEVFHGIGFTTTATGGVVSVQRPLCMYALVYDPVDLTALVGVADAMDYDHRMAPLKAGYDSVNAPSDFVKGGMHHEKWKIPAPVVDPGILSDLLDSNWVSTKDTSVIVGYLKLWTDAAGAATSSSAATYIRYHVEFRSRR
jgi:hypothetical protein